MTENFAVPNWADVVLGSPIIVLWMELVIVLGFMIFVRGPWRCGICMVRCTAVASRAAEGRDGRKHQQGSFWTDGVIVDIPDIL